MTPDMVIDLRRFGVLLRAARHLAGYQRATELTTALAHRGIDMSNDVLYAIERGDRRARADEYFALLFLLQPKGGHAWFAPAFRTDIRRWIEDEA